MVSAGHLDQTSSFEAGSPETLLELDSACCSYLENPALKIGNPLFKSEWPLLASKNAIFSYRNLTLGHLTKVYFVKLTNVTNKCIQTVVIS